MSSGRAAQSCCQQQNGYSAASRGAIGRGRATARAAGGMRAGCVRHVWSSGGLDPAPLLAREAAQHELTFAWRSVVCLHLLASHSDLDVPCPRASSDAVGGAVRPRAERRDATASRRTRRPARGASEKLKIEAASFLRGSTKLAANGQSDGFSPSIISTHPPAESTRVRSKSTP